PAPTPRPLISRRPLISTAWPISCWPWTSPTESPPHRRRSSRPTPPLQPTTPTPTPTTARSTICWSASRCCSATARTPEAPAPR
ncbi:hypothetical protein GGI02_005841, partial [Coemansia sp. RSA 2322]